jgi:DNA replication ATP-dependent helicase Dna2
VAHNTGLHIPASAPVLAPPVGWPGSINWDPAFLTVADPDHPVMCITYPEGVAGQWNQFEADLTVGLSSLIATHLQQHIANQSSNWLWREGLGIVTPHRAQRALITAGLHSAFSGYDPALIDAAVDTVERFQGQERWVILASYAVGDPDVVEDEAEFLQNLNRFNVLATRAKAKVAVMVSDELLNHIASDIDVIRSSRLLKSFADTYCSQTELLTAIYQDRHRGSVQIPLTIRWSS